MGGSSDKTEKKERRKEVFVPDHKIEKLNFKEERSTCKIIVTSKDSKLKIYGSGFFIKLKINDYITLNCLLTCEHNIISEKIGEINKIIKINYNEDEYFEIELDKNKRFIKGFKNVNLDIMLIEILKSNNIKDKYFLSFDIEEKNYYQKLVNKDIYIYFIFLKV